MVSETVSASDDGSTDSLLKVLDYNAILTWLIAREDFTASVTMKTSNVTSVLPNSNTINKWEKVVNCYVQMIDEHLTKT
jgi:hypothetical protein